MLMKNAELPIRRSSLIGYRSSLAFPRLSAGRVCAVGVSVALYIAALLSPAFAAGYSDADTVITTGWQAFWWGWITLPFFVVVILWPNPTPVLGGALAILLFYRGWRYSALFLSAVLLIEPWLRGAIGTGAGLANPLLWAVWGSYLYGYEVAAFAASAVAVIAIMGFLRVHDVPYGFNMAKMPIVQYGSGYWLWVASAVVMLVACGVTTARKHSRV